MNPAGAARALAYLAAHNVMTLATSGPEGPWAAAVFYVNQDFDLYFLSSPRARHSMNVQAHPAAAAAVHEDYSEWRDIQGVQLEGVVEILSGLEEARARALYGAKFAVARPGEQAPDLIAAALSRVSAYRFRARQAFFIDNAAGFGKRETVLSLA